MKRILVFAMVGLMLAATIATAQTDQKAGKAQGSQPVMQAQLAELLVKALGLMRFLPNAPTTQQMFDVLMQNGISPAGGWLMGDGPEAVVTKADLARVLVQALRQTDQVENPDDPQSWINALKALGISLDRLSETIQSVEMLPDAIAQDITLYSTDPLIKGEQLARDNVDVQYGVDFNVLSRVFPEIEMIRGEFRPISPTPF